jgi:hypothetical protein
MSKRPSSSWGTIMNLGVDAYQVKRMKDISNDIDNIRASMASEVNNAVATGTALTLGAIEQGTNVTLESIGVNLSAIKVVADLQVAMMANLMKMDEELTKLSDIAWKISDYFERKEERDQFVGSMRIILHYMERELDEIEKYQDSHTEYAVIQLEIIRDRIQQHDVKVEHFALVSTDEMKHAQAVLDRVQSTYQKLMAKLRNS